MELDQLTHSLVTAKDVSGIIQTEATAKIIVKTDMMARIIGFLHNHKQDVDMIGSSRMDFFSCLFYSL